MPWARAVFWSRCRRRKQRRPRPFWRQAQRRKHLAKRSHRSGRSEHHLKGRKKTSGTPSTMAKGRGWRSRLSQVLPGSELSFDREILAQHAGDKWFASKIPDAVALPRTV